MNRSLTVRILVSAVMSVVVAALLVAVGVLAARPLLRDAVIRRMVAGADLEACRAAPESWGDETGVVVLFAYDRGGRSRNPAAPALESDLLVEALTFGRVAHREAEGQRSVFVIPSGVDGPCAVLRASSSFTAAPALARLGAILSVTTVAGMLLAGLGTSCFVVRPLLTRIAVLSRAARRVGSEDFEDPDHDDDALGGIARVLSESHQRILDASAALEHRNRALEHHLAGVAHDLRTPLASMQLALEGVVVASEAGQQQEARRALADVVYLSALVENLHLGTRLRQDLDFAAGRADLVELVHRLEQRFAIVGRHADVEVAACVPEGPVWVSCTPTLAERAVANLVQNAIEHNKALGHVAIVLTVLDGGTRFELVVDDDGPGLPDSVKASLESESFLLDAARQRGPGLGMMITAEVARRAGWTLDYSQIEPAGLRARLRGQVAVR